MKINHPLVAEIAARMFTAQIGQVDLEECVYLARVAVFQIESGQDQIPGFVEKALALSKGIADKEQAAREAYETAKHEEAGGKLLKALQLIEGSETFAGGTYAAELQKIAREAIKEYNAGP